MIQEDEDDNDQPIIIEEDRRRVEGEPEILDPSQLELAQGGHTLTNKRCLLLGKSFKKAGKGYEEIHIPAPLPKLMDVRDVLIAISSLPIWMHPAFSTITQNLNRVQSRVVPRALETDNNLSVCAPTGAGKTNIALLTMLREIGKYVMNDGTIALDQFIFVYIAPMKALVQEQVVQFQERLAPFGITVSELTGDQRLGRVQLVDTQLIITTPEKWDIITRKSNDLSFTKLVKLIIIDEIHLLHDDRGPVLEAIVARTLRWAEETRQNVRIVALSATLPNYVDVARFIRVSSKDDVFFFDGSYRPCPLTQQYIEIQERKPFKRYQMLNDLTYEKVVEQAGRNQILVFVHSRKDTAKTAKFIRDKAIEQNIADQFVIANPDVLRQEVENVKNSELKDLLPSGFGIHHAGMTRTDRLLVERMFREGHIQVLIATVTLAWGVNLPAHRVIIKGTQFYEDHDHRYIDYPLANMVHMLHSSPECHLFCPTRMRSFYTRVLFEPLPLESQLDQHLYDLFNSEVAARTITSKQDAVEWMTYSFMYHRLTANPSYYNMTGRDISHVSEHLSELVENTITDLANTKCLEVAGDDMTINPLNLGQICAYYAVKHSTVEMFAATLTPTSRIKSTLDVLAASSEFNSLLIRVDDEDELSALHEVVPMKLNDGHIFDPHVRVNLLLQAHFSRIPMSTDLTTDLYTILPIALNLLTALVDVVVSQAWMIPAMTAMRVCQMIVQAMWDTDHPLKQIDLTPTENITSVYDFIELSDNEKFALLENRDASLIATFCNRYPAPEVSWEIVPFGPYSPGQELQLKFIIRTDYQDDNLDVPSLHYPIRHLESWWILITDITSSTIHSIKRITMTMPIVECVVDFEIPVESVDDWNGRIFIVSDSFAGVDQEHEFTLQIEG